jgi:ribosomal protein S18 acetylase RimI-like enzyme
MIKKIFLIKNGINVGECTLDSDNDNKVYLQKVKIYKEFRGKGYCYYLIKKVINYIKKRKLDKIYLHVKHDNKSAIKCYKKNGFKICRKNYDKGKLFGYTTELFI